MSNYFIEEGTIGFRSIREADRETFLRWHNDSCMREKIGGLFPFNENTFRKICCSYNEQHPSDIWFAVCDGDKLIGIVGLHNIKYIQRNAEVAIFIGDNENRCKGKGRIILGLLEEYAFGLLNLHRLYACVYSDNIGALRFFEKRGWEHEGVMRDASFWNYRFRNVEIWAKLKIQCMEI
jgi:RimJ/RimL family protein N-acetyltransferase